MPEAGEASVALAWRLLATLEGGSLLLAASALLAYTARSRMIQRKRRRNIRNVIVTNISNELGKQIKTQLESRGCIVEQVTSDVASEVTIGAVCKADALIVIGTEMNGNGLDDMAEVVTKDVYDNLKLLELLSRNVKRGGCIAWACAGATTGSFIGASAAFDAVLHASLQHIAKTFHCEPIWIGRCESAERAAERLIATLMPCTEQQDSFTIRNAASKVKQYLTRWLKTIA